MPREFDLVIRGGTIADGTGCPLYEAEIGIRDGYIAALDRSLGSGRQEIDASGLLITPGFVDVHTHYDGQAIWSDRFAPSSSHGVTTVVTGNCGVGFAPCRAADHEMLTKVMEGVEDIPEVVMTDGLTWDWEAFPQYLHAIERRPHDIDIATQLPHSALRVYVMGKRGAEREPATAEDLAQMRRLAREAISAGAIGFSSSRLYIHRTSTGDPIPSFGAAEAELHAIAGALGTLKQGVLQFVLGSPSQSFAEELALIARVAQLSGRPTSYSLAQDPANPEGWRAALAQTARANAEGICLRAQVMPRPIGLLVSHNLSVNPFSLCPSYAPLKNLSLAERVKALQQPDMRARLLEEAPGEPTAPLARLGRNFERMFPITEPMDYAQPQRNSISAQASRQGISPEALAYDLLLAEGGRAMLYVAIANYAYYSLDAAFDMMMDPNAILGLADGGAHYGMIADASYPTFVLSYWARDRKVLSLPKAVKALARDTARAVGLYDRGRIASGYKADINIIDLDRLKVGRPYVSFDLPAGGRRILQDAQGFVATIVAGIPISFHGEQLEARPGRLIRGAKPAPH